jgi:hypothetical protein
MGKANPGMYYVQSQITNLYQMCCSLFDNAIFEEARLILNKRSADSDGKKLSRERSPHPGRRFFRSISSEKDVAKNLEPNPEHHAAFFTGLVGKEGNKRRPKLSP